MRYPLAPVNLFAPLIKLTLSLSLDKGKCLLVVNEFKVLIARESNDLQDHQNLINICVARKQRSPLKKLSEDASNTPHVQRLVIGFDEETDFGSSVPSGHDVGRLLEIFIDFSKST